MAIRSNNDGSNSSPGLGIGDHPSQGSVSTLLKRGDVVHDITGHETRPDGLARQPEEFGVRLAATHHPPRVHGGSELIPRHVQRVALDAERSPLHLGERGVSQLPPSALGILDHPVAALTSVQNSGTPTSTLW
ncbi:hypothetical protein AB0G04_30695 [Actinoplanes sp. NPDC023801]|uniref:hypothetical protein n=1 Tax=Actinoplanes sp. NPDC023801 TaxID=3154595 RepID=UPI0033EA8EA0